MSDIKPAKGVVMITCQWCIPDLPEGSPVPGGGEVMSIRCTGAIRPDLIYDAFTRGAQGVLIIGCAEGECHYVKGNEVAKRTVMEVKDVFRRAFLDPRRIRLELVKNPTPAKLWPMVEDMRKVVRELGAMRIKVLPLEKPKNRDVAEIIRMHGGGACLSCGKCTALCPVSATNENFSPRSLVNMAMLAPREEVLSNPAIWRCRACGRCAERCPEGVQFRRIIRALREEAWSEGYRPQPLHGDFVSFLSMLSISPVFKNTWGTWGKYDADESELGRKWPPAGLQFDQNSPVAFYPGCLPFYETIFGKKLAVDPMEIATSAITILNNMGIKPRLIPELGCCGHDLYWTGRTGGFTEVAKVNVDKLEKSGIKTLITICPECASTFTKEYPKVLRAAKVEVLHLLEYMSAHLSDLRFHKRRARNHVVTYHDPCRLVRHLDVIEQPRKILEQVPQVELREMPYAKELAFCCGTAGWTGCDASSKQVQMKHLADAKATGAEAILTACPKCFLHFNCARKDLGSAEEPVKIQDIFTFLAASILPSVRESVPKKEDNEEEKWQTPPIYRCG
jgi:Fe-S oxidoreductase/coenzyme F420-reducing hydrogenase delta subunit